MPIMELKLKWMKTFFTFILLASRSFSLITATNKEFRDTAQPTWQTIRNILQYLPRIERENFERIENLQVQDLEKAQPIWQRILEMNPRMTKENFIWMENGQESENVKRGLDFGLNRGLSGTQVGKHLIGLTTANFANGPGRRRRSQ
ncbi:uncharacterized protein LOC127291357 [Leptopilina boulardi]|uniref:uncharacterized protein LOC127291357 n=1 Tax=Leptopilina boulardi TaxID=63433 RepID=UPI0021F53432|nr:uncharacterized protein LOC127291357 [Leptopilina boulardi]